MAHFNISINFLPATNQGSSGQHNTTNAHTTPNQAETAARITAIQNESEAKLEAIRNGTNCKCPLYSTSQLDRVIAARTVATGNESEAGIKAMQAENAARTEATQKENAARVNETIVRLEAVQKESAARIEIMRDESRDKKLLRRADVEARMKRSAAAEGKRMGGEEKPTQERNKHCGTCNCNVKAVGQNPGAETTSTGNRGDIVTEEFSRSHAVQVPVQFRKTRAYIKAIFKQSRELSEKDTLTAEEEERKCVIGEMRREMLDVVGQEVKLSKQEEVEREESMPDLEELREGASVVEQEERNWDSGEWGPTPDEVGNLKEAQSVEGPTWEEWGTSIQDPGESAWGSHVSPNLPEQFGEEVEREEERMEREQRQDLGGDEAAMMRGFGSTVVHGDDEEVSESVHKSVRSVLGITSPTPNPRLKKKLDGRAAEEIIAAGKVESGEGSEGLAAEQEQVADDEQGSSVEAQETIASQSAESAENTEHSTQASDRSGNKIVGQVLKSREKVTAREIDEAYEAVQQSEELAGEAKIEARGTAAVNRAAASRKKSKKKARAAKKLADLGRL